MRELQALDRVTAPLSDPQNSPEARQGAAARHINDTSIIVILPGFGNCSDDYSAPFGDPSSSLITALNSRGFKAYVVPLQRKDWFKVARALLRPGFWSASLTTDPGYSWYLDMVDETVKRALRANPGTRQVDLVGHSAGGWLARAYLGDPKYQGGNKGQKLGQDDGRRVEDESPGSLSLVELFSRIFDLFLGLLSSQPRPTSNSTSNASDLGDSQQLETRGLRTPNPLVRSLVTLGTPQRPAGEDKGKRDMTGGALTWVHKAYPGAYFASEGVRYVSVGGRTVKGSREGSTFSSTQVISGYQSSKDGNREDIGEGGERKLRTPQEYAFDAYSEVCGEGEGVVGDAVVPLSHVFLAGSSQVLLEGVWHSMSRVGTFEKKSSQVWYGSEDVVDQWLKELVVADGDINNA